jgi:SseB protein N-terminal domain
MSGQEAMLIAQNGGVSVLDRIRGREADGRDPAVRALHTAMTNGADDRASTATNAACFRLLAESQLWAAFVGTYDKERLLAQARLSGNASLQFRAGRTSGGETYLPAATTAERLARAGFVQPGDSLVRLPFRFLAQATRDGGIDALVINPGSAPMAHIAGLALASFADGALPDPSAPDSRATIGTAMLGPCHPITRESVPAGLVDAAGAALARELGIARGALVERSLGQRRSFTVLIAASRADPVLGDRVASQLVPFLAAADYIGVERVEPDDPRLADRERAITLLAPASSGSRAPHHPRRRATRSGPIPPRPS